MTEIVEIQGKVSIMANILSGMSLGFALAGSAFIIAQSVFGLGTWEYAFGILASSVACGIASIAWRFR